MAYKEACRRKKIRRPVSMQICLMLRLTKRKKRRRGDRGFRIESEIKGSRIQSDRERKRRS